MKRIISTAQIAAAESRGAEMFSSGMNCAPCLDFSWMAEVAKQEHKARMELSKAWVRGYLAVLLAAPH